jgi:hypothetical protein
MLAHMLVISGWDFVQQFGCCGPAAERLLGPYQHRDAGERKKASPPGRAEGRMLQSVLKSSDIERAAFPIICIGGLSQRNDLFEDTLANASSKTSFRSRRSFIAADFCCHRKSPFIS